MKKAIYSILLTIVLVFQVGLISSCTESETSIKKFEYEEVNGGMKITKYLGSDKKVVVPSTIENKKVIEITDTVFSGNVVLQELTLPEELGYTDSRLLSGCDSLKEITFLNESQFSLSSMKSLERLNFDKCNSSYCFDDIRSSIYYNEKLCEVNIAQMEYIPNHFSGNIPRYEKNVRITVPQEIEQKILSLTAVEYRKLSDGAPSYEVLSKITSSKNDNEIIKIDPSTRSRIIDVFSDKGYSLKSDFLVIDGEGKYINRSGYILIGTLNNGYNVESYLDSGLINNSTYYNYNDNLDDVVDEAIIYKKIDNGANMCICFNSKDVTVNGVNYKFDFK